jgi:hypothetical protein
MAGWSNHLDGAKALIRLRGKHVITESTPEGLEMFQLVRSMSVCNPLFESYQLSPIQLLHVADQGPHCTGFKLRTLK